MASRFLTEQDKNELVNKIPSKTTQLENDSNFQNEKQVKASIDEALKDVKVDVDLDDYALKEDIPTKTSQLENDSKFLTEHQDLSDYALKESIPIKTSQLENDSNYASQNDVADNLTAAKQYADDEIDELSDALAYINLDDNEEVNDPYENNITVVDSELSLESENPVQNKVITEEVQRLSEEKANVIVDSANGNNIVITDSANEKPRGMRLFGKSEQNTTGGNQLFAYPYVESTVTKNNVKYTDNGDGTVTIEGTATSDAYYGMYRNIDGERLYLKAGTYTISCAEVHPSWYISVNALNAASQAVANLKINDSQPTTTFTANEDIYIYSFIIVKAGNSVDTTVKPMLNKGSTALPFEPYAGGVSLPTLDYPQPIESVGDSENLTVDVYGGNLLDPSKFTKSNTDDFNVLDEGYTLVSTGTKAYFGGLCNLPHLIGKTIYISYDNANATNSNANCLVQLQVETNEKTEYFTVKSSDEFTIKLSEDVISAKIKIIGNNRNTVLDSENTYTVKGLRISILPNTSWTPYSKQFLTIQTPNGLRGIKVTDPTIANYIDENGQMWCCDEIDFVRGKYVQRVCRVNGEEIGNVYLSSTKNFAYFSAKNKGFCVNTTSISAIICTVASATSMNKTDNGTINYGVSIANDGKIHYRNKDFTTVDEYRTVMKSSDFEIVYILATPIEIDLTEEQLEAYKAIHTNYPTTTVTSDAFVEIDYVADTKHYIDNKFAELATALVAIGGN